MTIFSFGQHRKEAGDLKEPSLTELITQIHKENVVILIEIITKSVEVSSKKIIIVT